MKHIITILLIALLVTISCKKNNVTEDSKNISGTDTTSDSDENTRMKKYLKEGFIGNNIFRVIIISPEGSGETINDIKVKAHKRARTSLVRYLQIKERNITYNTKAKILTIVRNNSNLYEKKAGYKKGKIFYFDIKKPRIKAFLYGISSR